MRLSFLAKVFLGGVVFLGGSIAWAQTRSTGNSQRYSDIQTVPSDAVPSSALPPLENPQPLESPPEAPQPPPVPQPAVGMETQQPTIALAPAPRQAIVVRSRHRSKLEPGLTIIPGQGVWNRNGLGYFQGGITGDLGFRLTEFSPGVRDNFRSGAGGAGGLDLRFSLGGTGSDLIDDFGSNISELIVSAELRIYFHSPYINLNRFYVAPFFAVGALYNFATLGNDVGFGYQYNLASVSYLGGLVGFGLEFHFGPRFALTVDVRGAVQAGLGSDDIASGAPYFDSLRGIFRVGIGGVYYLPL